MKRAIIAFAFCFAGIAALVIAWNSLYPSGKWRYRITVTVETPEGIKTGSAVREITASKRPKTLPQAATSSVNFSGEAVVVDLGERGVLFALLETDGYAENRRVSYAYPLPKEWEGSGIKYFAKLGKTKPVTLPLKQYPRLVYFKDLKDPKSVERAYELETYSKTFPNGGYEPQTRVKSDNFEKAFGKGVKLKEITIEMTDDAVTWGIQKYLPWLPDVYGSRLDGERYNRAGAALPLANSLGAGAFSTNAKNIKN